MTSIATLADIVRAHGRAGADRTALEVEGRSISFAELYERSCQVAQALASHGVDAQARVAFVDKNSAEYFEVTFGLALLNAVNVAVNWRLAPIEMARIITDAEATVVIAGAEFTPLLDAVRDELPLVTTFVAVGGAGEAWADYGEWVASHPAVDPGAIAAPSDVAFQLYTSGTTGLPKGVMITNDNFFGKVIGLSEKWRFDPTTVNLAMMPMFHIAGAGWAMVGLVHGARTVVLRDIDPEGILDAIQRFGVTNAMMVPAVIQFLLALPGIDEADLSSLEVIVYGASPISEPVLLRALDTFRCEFIQLYGLTETAGAIAQLDSADHDPVHRPTLLRSCGRPFPWVELRVVGPSGEDVPQGGVGELWARSCQTMKGYWNNAAATAEAITPDGWFRTGDAGYLDSEGFLYLHDRVKDMIVTGAENVYPAEVENVLMQHPGVADVGVIGIPDDRWGEAVKAVVVCTPGVSVDADELIEFSRRNLAGFKVPKSVDFVDALPRNPSGKLLKRELREPYWDSVDRRVG